MTMLNRKNFLIRKSYMNNSSSSRGSPSSLIRHFSFLSVENYHSKSSFSKTIQIKVKAFSWSPWNPTLWNSLNLFSCTIEGPKLRETFFVLLFVSASCLVRELWGLMNPRFGFLNLNWSAFSLLRCSSLKYFFPPLSGLRLEIPNPEF